MNIQHSTFNIQHSSRRGFSLVEMIVSLGIFTIILFIATSSFLAIVNADRKSRAVRIAMDNLNLALEDMSRSIKTGKQYGCGGSSVLTDCPSPGGSGLSFYRQDGNFVTYKRATSVDCGVLYGATQGCILKEVQGGGFMLATSPEIDIKDLRFIVSGSALGASSGGTDTEQPIVVIVIDGEIDVNTQSKTTFKIQTAVTQREYDK